MSTEDFENKYKHWHQKLSFMKSGIRIATCLSAIIAVLAIGAEVGQHVAIIVMAVGLGLAEILGIFEEWI